MRQRFSGVVGRKERLPLRKQRADRMVFTDPPPPIRVLRAWPGEGGSKAHNFDQWVSSPQSPRPSPPTTYIWYSSGVRWTRRFLSRPSSSMAHVAHYPSNAYFYPIGNASAVLLTETLAPEESANLLLLGCGDQTHNILFTIYNEADHGGQRELGALIRLIYWSIFQPRERWTLLAVMPNLQSWVNCLSRKKSLIHKRSLHPLDSS